MILSGESWGGYLTLLGLGIQPERWSLGIARVPVADVVAAYDAGSERLKSVRRSIFGGTPAERPEVYRERSPITHVERVQAPILIIAGQHDPICPPEQIKAYVARLCELDKPHDTYWYGSGHSPIVVEETLRQLDTALAFAAERLGTVAG